VLFFLKCANTTLAGLLGEESSAFGAFLLVFSCNASDLSAASSATIVGLAFALLSIGTNALGGEVDALTVATGSSWDVVTSVALYTSFNDSITANGTIGSGCEGGRGSDNIG